MSNKDLGKELDDILADFQLPSDEEVALETGKIKRAEGVKRSDTREKISHTLKNSAAYKQGIANRDQSFRKDPTYQAEHKARMQLLHDDPVWQEKHRKGLEALRNDPERWAEYQENYRKGNTAKYEDPEYWANYYAAIKERDANPEYHKKRLGASKQKIRKPVQTPLGVFETQTDAAKAHGLGNTETIRTRIKSSNPKFAEYKSLTVEEYEQLKNE
jgi:hypothetical protein